MIRVRETEVFAGWLSRLRDQVAKAKIAARIRRLALGNPGDVAPVGKGMSELRINHGPGYRVYFVRRGSQAVILLYGGDKSTQRADIERASAMVDGLENES